MSVAQDFAAALRDLLDAIARTGEQIDLWWRDDDAVTPSPALDELLGAAERHAVPVALAVIPAAAGPALADRLSDADSTVAVLQHGFAHANHAPQGEKAAELGTHRPADMVLDEIARGRKRLESLFGDRFLPVLTPPWNRVGAEVAARRGEAGLPGLSTFARLHAGEPACVNTHIDIIDWKGGRRFAGYRKMHDVLGEEIGRRGVHGAEPLGLLTHHLVHDRDAWAFLETFLSVAARHPAARWPRTSELFGLRPQR